MHGMLRWPFRIVMYFVLYIVWSEMALLILATFPELTYIASFNILSIGWIPIAVALFVDLYLSEIRRRRSGRGRESVTGAREP